MVTRLQIERLAQRIEGLAASPAAAGANRALVRGPGNGALRCDG